MDTDRRSHWEHTHSARAAHEVSWYQALPEPSLSLIRDVGIAHNDAIIDVGAGASTLVDHLLDDGYTNLTCLDIAESALAASRTRLGEARAARVNWIVADITKWTPPEAGFALWHDRAAFHFLSADEERAAYVRCAARAVRPGGAAIIATFAPDGPARCSNLDVRRCDAEAIERDFQPHFSVERELRSPHTTPWGAEQKFAWFTLRRRG